MNNLEEYLAKRKANSLMLEVVEVNKSPSRKRDALDMDDLCNEVIEALAPISEFMIKAIEKKSHMASEYTYMCHALSQENIEGVVYSEEEKIKMLAIYLYHLSFNQKTPNHTMRIKYSCECTSANSISVMRLRDGYNVRYGNMAKESYLRDKNNFK